MSRKFENAENVGWKTQLQSQKLSDKSDKETNFNFVYFLNG
jgi:hypothetical protein